MNNHNIEKNIKIGIIAEEYPPKIGGIATSVQRIVSNLINTSIQVILVVLDQRDENNIKYLSIDSKLKKKDIRFKMLSCIFLYIYLPTC